METSQSTVQQPAIPPSEYTRKRNVKLVVRQQPQQSRVCGQDRRPIDPPPIIQFLPEKARKSAKTQSGPPQTIPEDKLSPLRQGLRGRNHTSGFYKENASVSSSHSSNSASTSNANSKSSQYGNVKSSLSSNPSNYSSQTASTSATDEYSSPLWFMYATLLDTTGNEVTVLKDGKTRSTFGSVVSSLYRLRDLNNADAGFFVFPDLSVRLDGNFQLKFSLFYLHIDEDGTEKVKFVDSVVSDVFHVYPAKRFPGMMESTELSKAFADQGIKIRIRKELRGKKSITYDQNSISIHNSVSASAPANSIGPSLTMSSSNNQYQSHAQQFNYNNFNQNRFGGSQNIEVNDRENIKRRRQGINGSYGSNTVHDGSYQNTDAGLNDGSIRGETRMYSSSSQNSSTDKNNTEAPQVHVINEDGIELNSQYPSQKSESAIATADTRPTLPSLSNAFGPQVTTTTIQTTTPQNFMFPQVSQFSQSFQMTYSPPIPQYNSSGNSSYSFPNTQQYQQPQYGSQLIMGQNGVPQAIVHYVPPPPPSGQNMNMYGSSQSLNGFQYQQQMQSQQQPAFQNGQFVHQRTQSEYYGFPYQQQQQPPHQQMNNPSNPAQQFQYQNPQSQQYNIQSYQPQHHRSTHSQYSKQNENGSNYGQYRQQQ